MSTLNAGTLNVTNTLKLPNYTTTQRNALSPAVGTMIFNTTDTIVEVWNGSEWAPAGGASETFIVASGGTVTESGIIRFIHLTAVLKTLLYHRLHLTLLTIMLSISLSLVAVAVVDLEVV